ncbi:PaaI family thioesterase [Thalassovita aquimarina]|uniref:PaaI family thioesterase n=1 Tax=Thalassovita aquimarina TaxID=2785917 RepID=A0ABS5HTM9_9RHOB|nr:PaaI family thioesterase [Thalassovita aquimarina]MBR9652241.1 PaaI family thioesterase [Thalassovita aquimarina]
MLERKIATSPDDLPSQDELLGISGLEAMQRMQRGESSGPPISRLLNYTLSEVEDGRVVFRGSPTFDATNPMGTVHGGWYGTVLDSCMACAVMTKVPRGSVYTTLEYKINILRPIPLGTEVEAIGVAQHVGRSTGIANGEIRGVEDGRLYATGSTTCIIMKLR